MKSTKNSFFAWFVSRLHDRASVLSMGMTLDTALLAVVTISLFSHTNALASGTSFVSVPSTVWQLAAFGFLLIAVDVMLGLKLLSSLEDK